jgi:hypothetical protein
VAQKARGEASRLALHRGWRRVGAVGVWWRRIGVVGVGEGRREGRRKLICDVGVAQLSSVGERADGS